MIIYIQREVNHLMSCLSKYEVCITYEKIIFKHTVFYLNNLTTNHILEKVSIAFIFL